MMPNPTPHRRHLPLGQIVATPGVICDVPAADMHAALRRHATHDWGELDTHDRQANNAALIEGTRILSAYTASNGVKFWIITEADRSATTFLLPEEY